MISRASVSDADAIARLAVKMWGSHSVGELSSEFQALLSNEDTAIFLCAPEGAVIGFAQCQLRRDYVEGTVSSPVGYLEGVFVEEAYRKQGYGKTLISACQAWAKEKGCTEFASDCELGNVESLAFHLASGFEEANRIICFVKRIG